MTVHVALLGRTPWALVNTYYASVMRGARPERVYVVTEERYAENLKRVRGAIEAISEAYGFTPEVLTRTIPDDDFVAAEETLRDIFQEAHPSEIVLNMTSGRKALIAAAIIQSRRFHVREILYMALLDVQFPNRPYMMLPLHMQRLKDFLGGE